MNWKTLLNPHGFGKRPPCGCPDLQAAKVGTVVASDPPIDKSKEGTGTDLAVLLAVMLSAGVFGVLLANDVTSPPERA